MYNCKEDKANVQNIQEIIRDFKGYVRNVVYRSSEYENIMIRKVLYSLKGYKSHYLYFDLMIKKDRAYYIGDHKGKIPLNK